MQEPTVVISFTLAAANFVLKTLGDLPTISGAYPLFKDIEAQANAQLHARETMPSPLLPKVDSVGESTAADAPEGK